MKITRLLSNSTFSIFLLCVFMHITQSYHIPTFFWLDYYGILPRAAVPGGITFIGKKTYIGSTYFPNIGVLPTILYTGDKYAYGAANNTIHKSDKNTKVLCVNPNNDMLSWRNVTIHSFSDERCIFIQLGYEEGCPLFVGRTQGVLGYQIVTGKVRHPKCDKKLRMEIWDRDSEKTIEIDNFEILGLCV